MHLYPQSYTKLRRLFEFVRKILTNVHRNPEYLLFHNLTLFCFGISINQNTLSIEEVNSHSISGSGRFPGRGKPNLKG